MSYEPLGNDAAGEPSASEVLPAVAGPVAGRSSGHRQSSWKAHEFDQPLLHSSISSIAGLYPR